MRFGIFLLFSALTNLASAQGIPSSVNKNIVEKRDDRGLVVSRREVVNGQAKAGFELDYELDSKSGKYISTGFRVFDVNGNLSRARSQNDFLPCGIRSPEKQERALVMDVVPADIRLPIFQDKILINSGEILNGKDDDGNGLIDDCAGFSVQEWQGNVPLIAPLLDSKKNLIELSPLLEPDVDHGTMTLSIAARDLTQVDFISVGGHLQRKAYYEAVVQTIAREKVRFVNVSLGVPGLQGNPGDEGYTDPAAYNGMKMLIEKSPQSLFVVAAGNGAFMKNLGLNIDRIGLYPAAFWMTNILSVAAANVNEISDENLPSIGLAGFSNVGVVNVDVVAPGENMHAALSGGGWSDTAKGTSFAAPYVLNLALKLAIANPLLSIDQIKELIMKTTYIPDLDLALTSGEIGSRTDINLEMNPRFFPVRSGGVVYPKRLFAASELIKNNPDLTIEAAALQARAKTLVQGETLDEAKLRRLWTLRKMPPSAR